MRIGLTIEHDRHKGTEAGWVPSALIGARRGLFWIAHAVLAGAVVLSISIRLLAYAGLLVALMFGIRFVSAYRKGSASYKALVYATSFLFWAPIFVFILEPSLESNDVIFYTLSTIIFVGMAALFIGAILANDNA
jgi:hypothetical protein